MMNAQDSAVSLCIDSEADIPHLVENPRRKRCEQHEIQRTCWSKTNWWRRRHGLDPHPWVPDPLTPYRRREALRDFADLNADSVHNSVRIILTALSNMVEVRTTLPSRHRDQLDLGVNRIHAACRDLTATANAMTGPRP